MRRVRARGGVAYWLAGGAPTVVRRAKNGIVETIMTTPDPGVELAVNDTHVFVITEPLPNGNDHAPGALWAAPLAGGPPQLLVGDLARPSEIRADETHVYWLTQGIDSDDGKLWRMQLPQ
jgi:hypothetical protein